MSILPSLLLALKNTREEWELSLSAIGRVSIGARASRVWTETFRAVRDNDNCCTIDHVAEAPVCFPGGGKNGGDDERWEMVYTRCGDGARSARVAA